MDNFERAFFLVVEGGDEGAEAIVAEDLTAEWGEGLAESGDAAVAGGVVGGVFDFNLEGVVGAWVDGVGDEECDGAIFGVETGVVIRPEQGGVVVGDDEGAEETAFGEEVRVDGDDFVAEGGPRGIGVAEGWERVGVGLGYGAFGEEKEAGPGEFGDFALGHLDEGGAVIFCVGRGRGEGGCDGDEFAFLNGESETDGAAVASGGRGADSGGGYGTDGKERDEGGDLHRESGRHTPLRRRLLKIASV